MDEHERAAFPMTLQEGEEALDHLPGRPPQRRRRAGIFHRRAEILIMSIESPGDSELGSKEVGPDKPGRSVLLKIPANVTRPPAREKPTFSRTS
jgi:hypothetical protein